MEIQPIKGLEGLIQKSDIIKDSSESNFGDILKDAINDFTESEKVSESDNDALLTGDSEELHNIMINMQKAEISLQFMMQVRNKMLDAYNEIMRMQL